MVFAKQMDTIQSISDDRNASELPDGIHEPRSDAAPTKLLTRKRPTRVHKSCVGTRSSKPPMRNNPLRPDLCVHPYLVDAENSWVRRGVEISLLRQVLDRAAVGIAVLTVWGRVQTLDELARALAYSSGQASMATSRSCAKKPIYDGLDASKRPQWRLLSIVITVKQLAIHDHTARRAWSNQNRKTGRQANLLLGSAIVC